MKVTYSKAEMLERCRLVGGFEPLRADCRVEYTDGIDLDTVLLHRLRSCYLTLLDSEEGVGACAENVGAMVSVSDAEVSGGGVVLTMPSNCRRVLGVRLRGWERGAAVQAASVAGRVMQRQLNRYTRATARHPEAVLSGEGIAGGVASVICWPAPSGRVQVSSVQAITDPGEDYYTLDESAVDGLCRSALSMIF